MEIHCCGIAVDPTQTVSRLFGTRVELGATQINSSVMRFYLSGTALSPSAGHHGLGVTPVNWSATPMHWAATTL